MAESMCCNYVYVLVCGRSKVIIKPVGVINLENMVVAIGNREY